MCDFYAFTFFAFIAFIFQLVVPNPPENSLYNYSWTAMYIRGACAFILLFQWYQFGEETLAMWTHERKWEHFAVNKFMINWQNIADMLSIVFSFVYCVLRICYPYGSMLTDEIYEFYDKKDTVPEGIFLAMPYLHLVMTILLSLQFFKFTRIIEWLRKYA